MEVESICLENHSRSVICAEDALDFNFNESEGTNDSNENSCCHTCWWRPAADRGQKPSAVRTKTPTSKCHQQVVPFSHYFQTPLMVKSLILIEGTVLKYAKSFNIDFCSHKNDIVLHINPRLDQNYIARNTRLDGSWGQEESCSVTMSPIQRGKLFQFQIYLLDKEFLVGINGQHMFSYYHRIPYREISRIEIFGDVNVSKVALEKWASIYPRRSFIEFQMPSQDLRLPLSRYMKDGFGYSGKIQIEGKVKLLPVSFAINIQESDQYYPHPKIIYHLNGRYSGDGCLVENSWGLRGEGWDMEVRSPLPPALYPGNTFSLSIETNKGYIKTAGTRWELPPFYHRLNPEKGFVLSIHGDIILTSLKIHPDPSTVSVF